MCSIKFWWEKSPKPLTTLPCGFVQQSCPGWRPAFPCICCPDSFWSQRIKYCHQPLFSNACMRRSSTVCSPRGKAVGLYDPEGRGCLCLGGLEQERLKRVAAPPVLCSICLSPFRASQQVWELDMTVTSSLQMGRLRFQGPGPGPMSP